MQYPIELLGSRFDAVLSEGNLKQRGRSSVRLAERLERGKRPAWFRRAGCSLDRSKTWICRGRREGKRKRNPCRGSPWGSSAAHRHSSTSRLGPRHRPMRICAHRGVAGQGKNRRSRGLRPCSRFTHYKPSLHRAPRRRCFTSSPRGDRIVGLSGGPGELAAELGIEATSMFA